MSGSRNLGIALGLYKFTEFLHRAAIFSFVKTVGELVGLMSGMRNALYGNVEDLARVVQQFRIGP